MSKSILSLLAVLVLPLAASAASLAPTHQLVCDLNAKADSGAKWRYLATAPIVRDEDAPDHFILVDAPRLSVWQAGKPVLSRSVLTFGEDLDTHSLWFLASSVHGLEVSFQYPVRLGSEIAVVHSLGGDRVVGLTKCSIVSGTSSN